MQQDSVNEKKGPFSIPVPLGNLSARQVFVSVSQILVLLEEISLYPPLRLAG